MADIYVDFQQAKTSRRKYKTRGFDEVVRKGKTVF
jgi:hypothetical protein